MPTIRNWPTSQILQCTCLISHYAPFRTEMCTFLFWMVHCGIWDRCIMRFLRLAKILHVNFVVTGGNGDCPVPTMTTKLTSMVWWCIVVPSAICPSARPSRPRYHSTSHNIQRILFIFGRAMLTLVVAWSLLIMGFLCSVALWNFMNTLTDLLPGLGRPGVPVLWTVFLYLMVHDENNIICFAVTW